MTPAPRLAEGTLVRRTTSLLTGMRGYVVGYDENLGMVTVEWEDECGPEAMDPMEFEVVS